MAIESPTYKLIHKQGNCELRDYNSYIIASVEIAADNIEDATNAGFSVLGDYIFGNNVARGSIAMTAPVSTQLPAEKIAMTVPVSVQPRSGKYTVSFTMPSKYTIDTLPRPINTQVEFAQIPAQSVAVCRFSGFTNQANITKHTRELAQFIAANHLQPQSTLRIDRFDPPFMPWFLRHNELSITVTNNG